MNTTGKYFPSGPTLKNIITVKILRQVLANSVDPDQTALEGAVSTLFAIPFSRQISLW